MRMIVDLLKRFRPLAVGDEFFGHLTYMRMPRGRISYWEAERTFSPIRRSIEVFIDAPVPEHVLTESQRDFVRTVERVLREAAQEARATS